MFGSYYYLVSLFTTIPPLSAFLCIWLFWQRRPRRELEENYAARRDDARGEGGFAPVPIHRVRREQGADYLAQWIAHGQGRLPGGADDVRVFVPVAEIETELWRRVEVAEELGVKG